MIYSSVFVLFFMITFAAHLASFYKRPRSENSIKNNEKVFYVDEFIGGTAMCHALVIVLFILKQLVT